MAPRVSTFAVAAVGRAGNYTGITERVTGVWGGLAIVVVFVAGVLLRRHLRGWTSHLFSSRPLGALHGNMKKASRADNKGMRELNGDTNRRFTKKIGQWTR